MSDSRGGMGTAAGPRISALSKRIIVGIATMACALGAGGAAHAPQAAAPAETTVLKAAHIFDSTNGKMRDKAMVVIRGGKIVGVGENAAFPADARIIELGDATLLPGFIDAHAHLTLEPDANYYRKAWNELIRSPAEQAFYAAVNARKTLEGGFTTVRHVGARYYIDVALRNAIAKGLTPGPRMLVSGNPITAPGGSCDAPPFPPERVAPKSVAEGVCSGADQCREAVRNQIKRGADVIKVCASGGVLSYDPVDVPQFTREELGAIISEAHAWGRKVAAHAHGDTSARYAIEAGVDSIEHGSFLSEETLKRMRAKGVYLVPTRTVVDWIGTNADNFPPPIAQKARTAAAAHGATVKAAIRLGVPIALGTDITVLPDNHGDNALEFVLLTQLGMTPENALLTGTSNAADLLGLEAEIGTIEVGKNADIVAVQGDPVADIRATRHTVMVMQRGQVIFAPGTAQ